MKAGWLGCLAGMLLAMPVAAQECFAGKPTKVTYDDGRVITIIQRHGDDVTYTEPYGGFQDSVIKTHMMLFPKASRRGARVTDFRWTTGLPKLKAMVPGYHFNIKGTMKSGDGKPVPYRNEGEVLAQDVVKIGTCNYDVVVVKTASYLDEQVISVATEYLSPDMMIVMRSDISLVSSGTQVRRAVVAIE